LDAESLTHLKSTNWKPVEPSKMSAWSVSHINFEDMPVQNTFVHFSTPQPQLFRMRSSPSPSAQTAPSVDAQTEPAKAFQWADVDFEDVQVSTPEFWPDVHFITPQPSPSPIATREGFRHLWKEDSKQFESTRKTVPKTEQLSLGEFTFMAHALETSRSRGGSSFRASGGNGTISIKCNAENLGERTVTVSVGREFCSATHNFSLDKICKIDEVIDFKNGKEMDGKISIVIEIQ